MCRHRSRGRGRSCCGYDGHFRAAAEYALERIRQGRLDLAPLVTHHLALERYQEGINLLERQEAIKVCFHPWGNV
jgi:threonine dehydrogenase-like Zn-dependent dehydrogenase